MWMSEQEVQFGDQILIYFTNVGGKASQLSQFYSIIECKSFGGEETSKFELLLQTHKPKWTFINYGLGSSSTIHETARSRISEGAKLIRKEKIDCISLSEIYTDNPISRPAILSIDVEGAELEVLQSNNWEQFIPDLICIEELTSPIQRSAIREFLEGQGYRLQTHNGVSSIYVWLDSTCLKL